MTLILPAKRELVRAVTTSFQVRSAWLVVTIALGLHLATTNANARPCADNTAVLVRGVSYIVYTGDGPYETENLTCRKARRIAKEAIRGKRVSGWRCRQQRRPNGFSGRCVRGGTYTDDYGNTLWRYYIGWYPYVPH